MKKKLLIVLVIVLAMLMVFPLSSWALLIPLERAFSNYAPGEPEYSAHYGDVEITDIGDRVRFDITLDLAVSGPMSDLHYFFFNINPDLHGNVIIEGSDIFSHGRMPGYSIDYTGSNNSHRAGPAGYFDAYVYFGSGAGTRNGGIVQNTSFTVEVPGIDLDLEDFDEMSIGNSEDNNYTFAAHIQSTCTTPGSEFVGGNPSCSVPEPSIVFLLGSLLIGVGVIGVMHKKSV